MLKLLLAFVVLMVLYVGFTTQSVSAAESYTQCHSDVVADRVYVLAPTNGIIVKHVRQSTLSQSREATHRKKQLVTKPTVGEGKVTDYVQGYKDKPT